MKIINKNSASGSSTRLIELPALQQITAVSTGYTQFLASAERSYISFQAQGDDDVKIAFSQAEADADLGIIIPAKTWVIFDASTDVPTNALFVKSTGADQTFVFNELV